MRLGKVCAYFVLMAAGAYATAQETRPPSIGIEIPASVRSEAMWIRYLLIGPGTVSDTVRPKPKLRRYVIYRRPDQRAKIVVYAPGCQFKAYSLGLPRSADVSLPFVCDPLPTRTLHGFLPVSQIPAPMFGGEKNLAIVGELDADWICNFFLQQRRGTAVIVAGSCLSSPTPLGTVGKLDRTQGGRFEITVPDFARDPLFKGSPEISRSGKFGVIGLALSDQKSGRILAGIKSENSAPEQGLEVQDKYPDPVRFRLSQ